MTVEADFTEFGVLTADLASAGLRALGRIVPVVSKAGFNVMSAARDSAAGLAHAPHYPRSITYDIDITGGTIGAEIGPDKDLPQGALGNLIEYGSANNAPHHDLNNGLTIEIPRFMEQVARIAGEIL